MGRYGHGKKAASGCLGDNYQGKGKWWVGHQKHETTNSAFLTKLGWQLKTDPAALWVRILKEKYGRGRDLDTLTGRLYSCSNAWHGIVETTAQTNQGLGVAIGDGRQTEFWNHKWLGGKILREHVLCPILNIHASNRGCDYWIHRSGWNWE